MFRLGRHIFFSGKMRQNGGIFLSKLIFVCTNLFTHVNKHAKLKPSVKLLTQAYEHLIWQLCSKSENGHLFGGVG